VQKPDTDVAYHVVYQKEGDPSWYVFDDTRDLFQHRVESSMYHQTTDLAEAEAVAQGLLDRTVFTDSRPQYQYRIAATQVYQTIITGGVVRTFGTPAPGTD